MRFVFLSIFVILLFTGCSGKSVLPSFGSSTSQPSGEEKIINTPGMHKATMRPYQINGKWYYPTTVEIGQEFDGIASWYGEDFHGKYTSNGEVYDMHKKTAAHKTFPMNTIVKVTNTSNNRSTIVRINDRGPFVGTRIIDMSKAGAQDLGMIGAGTAPVRLEVIGFGGVIDTQAARTGEKQKVEIGNFFVQIGGFKRFEGAKVTKEKFDVSSVNYKAVIKEGIFEGEKFYRVWASGFRSEEEAKDFIKSGDYKGAFTTRE